MGCPGTNITVRPTANYTTPCVLLSCAGSDSARYSIYSGDPNGYFSINPVTGTIRTNTDLDHETHPFVLLNVAAMTGDPPTFGHSQVRKNNNKLNLNTCRAIWCQRACPSNRITQRSTFGLVLSCVELISFCLFYLSGTGKKII